MCSRCAIPPVEVSWDLKFFSSWGITPSMMRMTPISVARSSKALAIKSSSPYGMYLIAGGSLKRIISSSTPMVISLKLIVPVSRHLVSMRSVVYMLCRASSQFL